ncbi:MAG: ethanolamine utilization protein [Rhodocyclaceae bacterium]|nr:ethanolamine utilization protein [Rhodocyclaceae bacterium]
MRLAFVDLETTGATATADRITEIGVIQVDEEGVQEWSTLVNPEVPISSFIERLTGISNDMVAAAPIFEDIADEVLERLQGRIFIAHNARFDYGFLKNEFKRLGRNFRAPVLCTVKLSRKIFPQYAKHSLDSLIERHGLQVEGRHRALADAKLIHQFWNRLQTQLAPEILARTLKELTARPSLPMHLDAAIVDELPDTPGVYRFYGENDLPLYVGKSTDIRSRVLAHFSADHVTAKDMALAQQVRRVDWIETGGEIGALLREAILVKSLQPLHNRQLRRNQEVCIWRLVESEKGAWTPQLAMATEVDFSSADDCFGPFKSPREANKALLGIADEHGLCLGLLGLEKLRPGTPCFGYQVKKCLGACVGREPLSVHSARLMAALARLRVAPWPFDGPAVIREGDGRHIVNAWRYLGTVRQADDVWPLLETRLPDFDLDIYKILVKRAGRMRSVRTRS